MFLNVDLSLLRFISAELTRGYFLEHNEAKYTERRERVYTCMRIPKELEKVKYTLRFNLKMKSVALNYLRNTYFSSNFTIKNALNIYTSEFSVSVT